MEKSEKESGFSIQHAVFAPSDGSNGYVRKMFKLLNSNFSLDVSIHKYTIENLN